MLIVQGQKKMFVISHGQKHRSWRVLSTWFQYFTVFDSNEQVYLVLPKKQCFGRDGSTVPRHYWYKIALLMWSLFHERIPATTVR